MIANILLVAKREFRQVTATKSFWLTLLLVPIALAIGPLVGDKLQDDTATKVMIVDQTGGGVARTIEDSFTINEDRALLVRLSRYVQRHDFDKADPQAVWAQHDRWYTNADVASFRAAGGLKAALAKIDTVRPEGVPAFDAPTPDYSFLPPPAGLTEAPADTIGTQAKQLTQAKGGDDKKAAADIVLLIGKGFPQDPTVSLWSNDRPRSSFVIQLQQVLTQAMRGSLLQQQGVSPQAAVAIETAAPAIAVSTPPPGGGAREAMLVRSIVPLALAYILMMSLMLSGSWMLQGSVEERSNKLLESVLACISPEELMYGKLLGALTIGLSMVAVWLGCAAFAAYATHGAIADMIRPALAPLTSPGAIIALIYFFAMGYLAISIIFVAIGAMSDSMREAQGYLMPVMLAVLLPITMLIQAVLAGNNGIMVQVLTWVPLWTPFAVLARLGIGIETWELIGSGVVLAIFVALEVVFLGRLFRASLLAQGQKLGLKQIVGRLKAAPR
ncbi:ABC transporter permease [Porphyrobacter algicida]|uniref:ABC transporter permease n=1 Tax=Qipengyuania algicida TaxID=1836209 RepID=A0A845AGP6_9SPHN|nr:ABC transporter permease [Qipengyuania algicida]